MNKTKNLVAIVAMLFATALPSAAEGTSTEATAATATTSEVVGKPNGNSRGITFWAVTDTLRNFTYMKVVADGKNYVAEPSMATRLRGIVEETVTADSLGNVQVKVVLAKGNATEHRVFMADSTWLGAKVGRGIAWTKAYLFDGKDYRLLEDYVLLSKAEVDGAVYREFNCEFQEPQFKANEAGIPSLPALSIDQFLGQTKSASTRGAGGLRIMGKKSAAEQTRDDIVAAINDPSCTVRSRTRVVGN